MTGTAIWRARRVAAAAVSIDPLVAAWNALPAAAAWGNDINLGSGSGGWTQAAGTSTPGTAVSVGPPGSGATNVPQAAQSNNSVRVRDSDSLTVSAPAALVGWIWTDVAGTLGMRRPDQGGGTWDTVTLATGWNFVGFIAPAVAVTLSIQLRIQSPGDATARGLAVWGLKCGTLP